MAQLHQRRSQNAPGNFYVDATCIDCDTCRWMAPTVFNRQDGQSAVYHQPTTDKEQWQAMEALFSCPTASIGTLAPPDSIQEVQARFPRPITPSVFHCGYHSEKSYGAASYLILRPDGNVLVDSPRFAMPLVRRIERMGGIRYLYLTHRDDVADHQQYRDYFGCDRILHKADITEETQDVEIKLSGSKVRKLAPDLTIIPVPGHTKGHTVLLYDDRVLFSGDHLALSPHLLHLYTFRRHCWHSWTEQMASVERLKEYEFDWVLPGHGHSFHGDRSTMGRQLDKCVEWMKTVA
ncbi:MAG: MBL fold metallo-hydrolase [Prochlorothrix sp.]